MMRNNVNKNYIDLGTIGVHKENYFEDTGHFSVSKYKSFQRCEVGGMVGFGSPTTAMEVGSYVDSYVEGTLDKFIEDNPQIISSRGATKGKLKSEFKQAEEICRFIDNDKTIQQFLSGEKQVIMTGEIEEVPFKIMMDSYSKGIAISDLKVMASITDRQGNYYDFISSWGYDIQLACYQEIVFQNIGERLPTYIVVVTKESPINSAIVHIPQHILDQSLLGVKENINHYYNVWKNLEPVSGCGKCRYCISNRMSTPIISMETLQGGVYDEN